MLRAPGQPLRNLLLVPAVVVDPNPVTPSGLKLPRRDVRLSSAGHLLLAMAVVVVACAGLVLARKEAQRRLQNLAYCQLQPIRLQQAMPATVSSLLPLSRALPSASSLQRQRLIQQANEFAQLYRYHCNSMQLISANYQSLVMVANGSAMVAATMLALLSVHGIKSETSWPFTVLMASAFTLGLAVVSIQTFNFNDNLRTSRQLYEQTISLARGFATSIANQQYAGSGKSLNLLDRQELGLFIGIIDQQLNRVDIPTFVMNDTFASKEALLLLHKASPDNSTPQGEAKD